MHIFKLIIVVLSALISMPVMAEEPVQPAIEATAEVEAEQTSEPLLFKYERPEREGPATATDRIVDRFLELNINPEESAGVDFEEYFTMVQQRAMDRFESMDANLDDEVTEEEYREFWKAQKAQYYRLKR
ncbi:MAG: hypothetical protein ABUK11_05330 [Mariprofundaceae bacterium]